MVNYTPMHSPHTTPLTLNETIGAVLVAFVYIAAFSLVNEPYKKRISALIIAGAGAVYWSGGLGVAEFIFGTVMLWVAYKSLDNYVYAGVGMFLHTAWDIAHHLYGEPIIYSDPSSSIGCAIADPIIGIWYLFQAPTIFKLGRRTVSR